MEAVYSQGTGLLLGLVAWLMAHLHWLFWAYCLEFEGLPVHLVLWIASLLVTMANAGLLCSLINAFQAPDRQKTPDYRTKSE
jgi:hypothetical protein